jgi:hypothetical protein
MAFLDLTMSVFQVHGVDAHGTVVVTKRLRRAAVLAFFANRAGMRRIAFLIVLVSQARSAPRAHAAVALHPPGWDRYHPAMSRLARKPAEQSAFPCQADQLRPGAARAPRRRCWRE